MTGAPSDIELAAMVLLEQAFEQPSDARADYISGRSDIEPRVREQALALLAGSPDAVLAFRTGGANGIADDGEDIVPDIPGYRLLRLLGQGGMGAVYLAERDAGDFEHRVAIKVIKPGVLSESLIERFRRERQILARLNHPHIARLYDGGETAQGQPFIVMEYVEGGTLWAWLQETRQPLSRRLALFRQIAGAVAFAHQNLIIHRDLTPGNILITPGGEAKLIDFGIARPNDLEDAAGGTSTISGLSLTPGFAAPERSQGAAANTLSDVYSLGKILELVIGEEPAAELRAIAHKAASVSPENRYPGASEIIEDLERFQGSFPVAAYSTARSYRIRSFIARERKSVATAGILLLSLLAGLAGTTVSYLRAERERAAAEQRFDDLRELAHHLLFETYDKVAAVPGTVEAREDIASTALSYLDTLAADDKAPADIQLEVALGYQRLAKVVGSTNDASLGKLDQGQRLEERALAIMEGLYAKYPQRRDIADGLAYIQVRAASEALWAQGDMERALELARGVQPLVEVDAKTAPGTLSALLDSYRIEASAQQWMGNSDLAVQACDKGLSLKATLPAALRSDLDVQLSFSTLYTTKGMILAETGKPDLAAKAFAADVELRRALARKRKPSPPETRNYVIGLFYLAKTEAMLDRPEAGIHADEALQILTEAMRTDAHDMRIKELYAGVALFKASLLAKDGKRTEATALVEAGIASARDVAKAAGKVKGANMPLATRLGEAAAAYGFLGDTARQCTAAREGVAIMQDYARENTVPEPDRKQYLKPMEDMLKAC